VASGTTRGATAALPADGRPPFIGRYQVVGRIGRGGMGMVYRGLDAALERHVAVKTLSFEGTIDEESRKRFEIEAKAAARLQHPNIVTVYELGEDRGVPFIAMELLPGADLESLLRSKEPLELHERLEIAIQACRGLAYAHDHGIVHRDIKPSNLRLLDDGTVKILDFGIAKLGTTNVTRAGMMVGTVNYMSPEQIRGLTLDGRSDVFSLGVILYQMLAGRRPFVGKGGTDVLYRIVQDPTPPLDVDLGPQGDALKAIVEKALAKDREQRYPTALALASDLEKVLEALLSGGFALPGPGDVEAVSVARGLLRANRADDAVSRLEAVVARRPGYLDARRLLRAARRTAAAAHEPPATDGDTFPELDATFKASATQRTHHTLVEKAPPETATSARPRASRAPLLAAVGVAVVLALAVTGFLLLRSAPAESPTPAAEPSAAGAAPEAVVSPAAGKSTPVPAASSAPKAPAAVRSVPTRARVAIETEPGGALVSVDGEARGAAPQALDLDTGTAHVVSVSQEGFETKEVSVEKGRIPANLKVTLKPLPPPGTVTLLSGYPIDVQWRGRTLAKGETAAKVSLPAGRQTLTLISAQNFLRRETTVDVVSGGVAAVEAPGLGRINIKANPDNCEVLINGAFVDYPPILDRSIVEGTHTVSFRWPDGMRRDETVEVRRGGVAYVMGRRN